jgi:hypothetical protein
MSALWTSRRVEGPPQPAAKGRGSSPSVAAFACVLVGAALLALALLRTEANATLRGGYSFAGGTPRERETVRDALAASSFDWNAIPGHVTVHIRRGGCYAEKGSVWLDPAMLAQGRASWGVIQHEFAHEVDFFLFNSRIRSSLATLLGAKVWWSDDPRLRHDQLGAERFASTLAWAYWPCRSNSIFRFAHAEATAMPAARFHALMDALLARRGT